MNFPENMKEVSTYNVNLEKRRRFEEDGQPIEVARCDSVAKNNEYFPVKSIIRQNMSDAPMGPQGSGNISYKVSICFRDFDFSCDTGDKHYFSGNFFLLLIRNIRQSGGSRVTSY